MVGIGKRIKTYKTLTEACKATGIDNPHSKYVMLSRMRKEGKNPIYLFENGKIEEIEAE